MNALSSVDSIRTSQIVKIPGWCGEDWECELKRPSILALAAKGAIANPLMKTARRLFYAGISPDGGDLAEEGRVLVEIARAAMVRPTFDELEDAGISLTDEQLVAIFQFTQLGVKALDRFRQLSADSDRDLHGAALPEQAE